MNFYTYNKRFSWQQSYQIGRNGRSVRPPAAVAAESEQGRVLWRENARADCSRRNLATPTPAMLITDRWFPIETDSFLDLIVNLG